MRDLKHIHFFEGLLEQADNELVRAEKADGGIAVGPHGKEGPLRPDKITRKDSEMPFPTAPGVFPQPRPARPGRGFTFRGASSRSVRSKPSVQPAQEGEGVLCKNPCALINIP